MGRENGVYVLSAPPLPRQTLGFPDLKSTSDRSLTSSVHRETLGPLRAVLGPWSEASSDGIPGVNQRWSGCTRLQARVRAYSQSLDTGKTGLTAQPPSWGGGV